MVPLVPRWDNQRFLNFESGEFDYAAALLPMSWKYSARIPHPGKLIWRFACAQEIFVEID